MNGLLKWPATLYVFMTIDLYASSRVSGGKSFFPVAVRPPRYPAGPVIATLRVILSSIGVTLHKKWARLYSVFQSPSLLRHVAAPSLARKF